MSDWRDRVIQECQELEERRAKLWEFIVSPKIGMVDKDERHRLHSQYYVMTLYVDVLTARIGAMKP